MEHLVVEQTVMASKLSEEVKNFKKIENEYLSILESAVKKLDEKSVVKKLKERKGSQMHEISKKFDGKTLESLSSCIEVMPEKKSEQPPNKERFINVTLHHKS